MTMVNAKLGVNAFGATSQKPESINTPNTLSAQDKAKVGEEDLGAVANKLSDPNWTDPSKKVRTAGNPNLDKDAFFKLMLAQMKNQDPTNPMKSHEMAAQLAN
ncbi:MAG: flagellar hook capping FlgD N-terminal domain-containing protein, partial [Bacillota bacterium]